MPNYSIGTDKPWVFKGELECAQLDFDEHIHAGDVAEHGPIPVPAFAVKVSDFMARIDALQGHQSGGRVDRAVIVHHGLDANDALDIALEFVKLRYIADKDHYAYIPAIDYYRPVNGSLQQITNGHAAWYTEGKPGHRYTERVLVRPSTDPDWQPFEIGVDVQSTCQAYEEALEDLIRHNGAQGTDTLRIVPIALPTARNGQHESGFHHTDAWYLAEYPPDDTDHGQGREYQAKAADLSSCCPPNTVNPKFAVAGLTRKTGCVV